MSVHLETIALMSHGGTPSYLNVTAEVKGAIARSGITTGSCTVISPHTTCSVFFEEFVHDTLPDGSEYLQADLDDGLARIFPNQTAPQPEGGYRYPGPKHYAEVETWPDVAVYIPDGDRAQLLNAEAHLRSTLVGSSQVFAVEDGALAVGVTGYIYFVDFDRSRPRPRRCQILVMGE